MSVPQVAQSYTAGLLRDVGLPLVAVVGTLLLPFQWILILFIVTGHAHFLMAYIYQARAGKMDKGYLLLALLTLLLLGSYLFYAGNFIVLVLAVGLLFSAHFAYDEFTLHGEKPTLENFALVLGFSLFFLSLVASYMFPGQSLLIVLAFGIAAVTALVRLGISRKPISRTETYLVFIMLLIAILAVGFQVPERVLGVIVLLHVANWYVSFGVRLRANPARARKYWLEVAATLTFFVGLFLLFTVFHVEILRLVFGAAFYYAWAIAHIVLSFYTSIARRNVVAT
ncbi:MAG: hypothetical protein KA104_01990 [Candidatus Pacebacteria bacterium]|nr:hypothetical protein [Candidatus Paceibacterota bacterium]